MAVPFDDFLDVLLDDLTRDHALADHLSLADLITRHVEVDPALIDRNAQPEPRLVLALLATSGLPRDIDELVASRKGIEDWRIRRRHVGVLVIPLRDGAQIIREIAHDRPPKRSEERRVGKECRS